MKKIILFFGLFLVIFGCKKSNKSNLNCLPTNLQSGVIALFPFKNGSLTDESLNGNNLSNTSSATSTTDRKGNTNCAFLFANDSSPKDEFLTSTNSKYLNQLSSFSVSLWYFPLKSPGAGKYQVLFGRGTGLKCPDRQGEWSLGLYDCSRAVFGHNNSVWAKNVTNSNGCGNEIDALSNKWHHVVAVKNGNEYQIYFDGKLDASETGNANCGASFLAVKDLGDVFVGKGFHGKIDDIIVYNKALSAQNVSDLFKLEPCCD
jgi:hypothetical protein